MEESEWKRYIKSQIEISFSMMSEFEFEFNRASSDL